MSYGDLKTLSARDLLLLHSRIANELRQRGISRSSNNPVADLAEWLVACAFGLELVEKSATGFDARDPNGLRYEIKARRLTRGGKATHLSAIRGLPEQHFDYLVAILFSEDFSIDRAFLLPFATVKRLARYRKHVNGSYVYFRDIWSADEAEDITGRLRKALESAMTVPASVKAN